MFNKKGYLDYFDELYKVEIDMKESIDELLKIIEDPKSREILEKIRGDEIRHAIIVNGMKDLIND